MGGMFNASHLLQTNDSKEPEYIILDNLLLDCLMSWKELLGAQRNWTTTDKYLKKVDIPGGLSCIFCTNIHPMDAMGSERDPRWLWLKKNIVVVEVTTPLWEPLPLPLQLGLEAGRLAAVVPDRAPLEPVQPLAGPSRIRLDENTVYLEDLISRSQQNSPMRKQSRISFLFWSLISSNSNLRELTPNLNILT